MKADTVLVRGDTIREVEKRILIDFMDLLILLLVCCYSGLVGGYDALRFLQRRYRFLPSPGTVYSRLYELERGAVKGQSKRKEKGLYSNLAWRRDREGGYRLKRQDRQVRVHGS